MRIGACLPIVRAPYMVILSLYRTKSHSEGQLWIVIANAFLAIGLGKSALDHVCNRWEGELEWNKIEFKLHNWWTVIDGHSNTSLAYLSVCWGLGADSSDTLQMSHQITIQINAKTDRGRGATTRDSQTYSNIPPRVRRQTVHYVKIIGCRKFENPCNYNINARLLFQEREGVGFLF